MKIKNNWFEFLIKQILKEQVELKRQIRTLQNQKRKGLSVLRELYLQEKIDTM